MKMENILSRLGRAAFSLLLIIFVRGCSWEQIDGDPAELAGRWYSSESPYGFAFEVTKDKKGYTGKDDPAYDVSVSGNYAYFKYHGNTEGAFHYSIKNDELTITSGSGKFSGIEASSPFIKAGTIPSGGSIPVEFTGKWYSTKQSSTSPHFEIIKDGKMSILGASPPSFNLIVSSNPAAVLDGSVLKGTFQYSFDYYGDMAVTEGKDICAGLSILSPFVKNNN